MLQVPLPTKGSKPAPVAKPAPVKTNPVEQKPNGWFNIKKIYLKYFMFFKVFLDLNSS